MTQTSSLLVYILSLFITGLKGQDPCNVMQGQEICSTIIVSSFWVAVLLYWSFKIVPLCLSILYPGKNFWQ